MEILESMLEALKESNQRTCGNEVIQDALLDAYKDDADYQKILKELLVKLSNGFVKK